MYDSKMSRALTYLRGKSLYFLASTILLLGYFPGSSKLHNILIRVIPVWNGIFLHPIGFFWKISSRDSLRTFLTSCEPFTTTLVTLKAIEFNTFICIGANRGWYPLVAVTKNKDIKVIAYECNSSIFKDLEQNISINNHKLDLHKVAIGSQNTELKLYMPHNGNEGMSTLYPLDEAVDYATHIETVVVTTLDESIGNKLRSLGKTLVLMDIEGSEMLALKGAENLLRYLSPTVILEINPSMLSAAGSSAASLFDYMESFGYQIFWIDEKENLTKVTDKNVLPHSSSLPSGTGANYLFTQHSEKWLKWIK